jgi:exportin-T
MFLRTLSQVVYGFKSEIHSILDTLLAPLLTRVFAGLASETTGTDDEIQLHELKAQFLAFVLVILNNDLSTVLVSPANQSVFEHFISTLTGLAIDPSDAQIARQSFSALVRIAGIWGGPDIPPSPVDTSTAPAPLLPGFDGYMLSTFAPLPWALLRAPGFSPGDAQMRFVVQEAAALQWTLWRKVGGRYRTQVQEELRSLGVGEEGVRGFVESVVGEEKGFRKFFGGFVGKGR